MIELFEIRQGDGVTSWRGDVSELTAEVFALIQSRIDACSNDGEKMSMLVKHLDAWKDPTHSYAFNIPPTHYLLEDTGDYKEDEEEIVCFCHRCAKADGLEVEALEYDYCYEIAYHIDENGNYTDDAGNYRDGQTHDAIDCAGCNDCRIGGEHYRGCMNCVVEWRSA